MKLLYISPSPPNELERTRTLNLLKAFKKNNINITLVTLYNKKQEKYLKNAEKLVDNMISIKYSKIISYIYCIISLFLPIPVRVGYCFNLKLIRKLKKTDQEYDVCYIKRLRMAQYKKYVKAKRIFIDITDSLTKYYERLYRNEKTIKKLFYFEEYFKLKRYEIKVCNHNNIIICSNDDKEYIDKISKKTESNIQVIENVININKWKRKEINISEKGKRNKLCFLGVMNYKPNIIAVKYIINNIVPYLSKNYIINIIGPSVPRKIKSLERKNIKFLGYIENVEEELEKNDIFVCPILVGSGSKNKIIQAGELGLPIVGTELALEGLPKELKKVIYIANTEKEFIQKIEEIQKSDDVTLKARINKQKEIIEKYNSFDLICSKIKKSIIN